MKDWKMAKSLVMKGKMMEAVVKMKVADSATKESSKAEATSCFKAVDSANWNQAREDSQGCSNPATSRYCLAACRPTLARHLLAPSTGQALLPYPA